MVCGQRVLIVDPSVDSREVVRTALERQGVAVFEADSAQVGVEMARQCRPDLVVIDGELNGNDTESDATTRVEDLAPAVPRIVLGRVPRIHGADRILAKPYHYATLIRTIEELLATDNAAQRPAA